MRFPFLFLFFLSFTVSRSAGESPGPDREMNFRDWVLEPAHAVNVRLVDNRAGNRVVEDRGSVLEVRLNHRAEAGPGNNGLVLQLISLPGGHTILPDGGPLVPGFLIRRGEGGTGQRALNVLVDDFDAVPGPTTDR